NPTVGALAGSPALLRPYLVEAGEGLGVLDLETVPIVEIGQVRIVGKACRIEPLDPRVEREAQKLQIVFGQKGLDLRQRVAVFLDVEQKIPAVAGREK